MQICSEINILAKRKQNSGNSHGGSVRSVAPKYRLNMEQSKCIDISAPQVIVDLVDEVKWVDEMKGRLN